MTWTLRIDAVAPSGNRIMRMAWPAYHRLLEYWFLQIRAAEGFLAIPKAKGKRKITVIRHGKPLDGDNLAFSTKPIFDVLRPPKVESGIYRSGKHKGQPWQRERIGHGLILEDDAAHVQRLVLNGTPEKGQKPYTLLVIEDVA